MNKEILVGLERYKINKYLYQVLEGYSLIKANGIFTDEEVAVLKQQQLFQKKAVVVTGALDKGSYQRLENVLLNDEICNLLVFIPDDEDKRRKIFKTKMVKRFDKLSEKELRLFIEKVAFENNVATDKSTVDFLIQYSEYLESKEINLYHFEGLIRACSGGALTLEHIKSNFQRSPKENAFLLLDQLHNGDFSDYFERLDVNPYALVGALMYTFRILFKLKLVPQIKPHEIGISSYQLSKYQNHQYWSSKQLIEKLKILENLKTHHESETVMKSIIFSLLVD